MKAQLKAGDIIKVGDVALKIGVWFVLCVYRSANACLCCAEAEPTPDRNELRRSKQFPSAPATTEEHKDSKRAGTAKESAVSAAPSVAKSGDSVDSSSDSSAKAKPVVSVSEAEKKEPTAAADSVAELMERVRVVLLQC